MIYQGGQTGNSGFPNAHTGAPSSPIAAKEIVSLLITSNTKRFTAAELKTFPATIKAGITATGADRIYPIHNIINLEPSGGDAVVSKVGYGGQKVVKYDNYLEKYRLDGSGQWMARELKKFSGRPARVILIDKDGTAIMNRAGLDSSGGQLYMGIPLSDISANSVRANGTETHVTFITLYYEDYDAHQRNVELISNLPTFTPEEDLRGLIGVTLVPSAGKKVNVVDPDSGCDYGAIYGATLADVTLFVGDAAITAVAYNAADNSYTITGGTKVALAPAATLAAKLITAIEGDTNKVTLIA